MPLSAQKPRLKKSPSIDPALLSQWDKQWIWHPFTQMAEWAQDDILIIASGKGSYLRDLKGRRYIDGVSSLWCNVHGHRVRELDQAVKNQLRKIAHSTFLGLSNVPAIQLAKKLIEIVPRGLKRVFYSDSGSESVEAALKIAYQYWQQKGERKRTKFICLKNAYHGDTVGAVSVGGIELFYDLYRPLLFETFSAPSPYRYRDQFEGTEEEYSAFCANKLEAVLQKHHQETCALIMEPLMQGAAGMIHQPKGYISRARELTKQYNILLIFDEVATGFGRTGRMFASDHESVTPDILCLAKGLSAGYLPLAATVTTEEIYEAFLGRYEELKTFFHGHTYTANPLACAVSVANLEFFERARVIEKLAPKVQFLRENLKSFYQLKHVGDIRQAGFMVGIELVRDSKTKKPYELGEKIGIRVIQEARRLGVIIRPLGNVIVLMPPLGIEMKDLKRLLQAVYTSIRKVTES
ncbi:MAG: adenosylmethionine--8-amino-7-oxononanoate transaminase [Omnitrophica bacterium RIFCSPHIGHO2_02_FULL_46_11]|nr:MAG: adenosylmethionine--8-amino-7-oxononanoate transaminase [Omnitrophica bacterium RIFCSPLOWO2_01_FULL_45_10b]OGW87301.1 MAG: adenosylmethionine--8-amino-7-oxononanoate transaminase [Omnitrophica bacterium RIFCSPHIGHO2_02_FULL_46_11]